MKKILPVTKVAFMGETGDDRSPEDFPFPACMTSLMEALGEDCPRRVIFAHNRSYTNRLMNHQFLAASGMAFALLWHPEFCMSAMDVMQAPGYDEALARGFRYAGYAYRALGPEDRASARDEVVRSIDRGVPVLGVGLFDPPECAIVCGYDEDGAVLIGWSHFQGFAGLETEENGMFRLRDWQENYWTLLLPGAKAGRSLEDAEIVRFGLSVMKQTRVEGYLAGQEAHGAWTRAIKALDESDEAAAKVLFEYHNGLLFGLAELRCFGGDFLREVGEAEAADCFSKIHDLCWKANAQVGNADQLREPERRAALLAVLEEIRALDQKAMEILGKRCEQK